MGGERRGRETAKDVTAKGAEDARFFKELASSPFGFASLAGFAVIDLTAEGAGNAKFFWGVDGLIARER